MSVGILVQREEAHMPDGGMRRAGICVLTGDGRGFGREHAPGQLR
jgi:hypothetical protein